MQLLAIIYIIGAVIIGATHLLNINLYTRVSLPAKYRRSIFWPIFLCAVILSFEIDED